MRGEREEMVLRVGEVGVGSGKGRELDKRKSSRFRQWLPFPRLHDSS